jgi:hypothetical protein
MEQILIGILGGIIGILGFKLISKGLDNVELKKIESELGKILGKKEAIDEKLKEVDSVAAQKIQELEVQKQEKLDGQDLADFFNNRKR